MKRQLFKLLIAAIAATIAFNSCEKETQEITTEQKKDLNSPLVIDGKKMEWNFNVYTRPRSLTKGLIMNEANYYAEIAYLLQEDYGTDYKLLDTLKFVYNNTNYKIKLLRIDRKSEPGKYFYVMIDNLNVKMDTACWAYNNNEKNVNKYGRLYTWHSANALAKKITMKLPVYKKNNPTQKLFNTKLPVQAKLLSHQDICDIIECDAIGNLPKNGYTIDKHQEDQINSENTKHGQYDLALYYYDVFVGGLEGPEDNIIDYSRGERTLAGFKDAPTFGDNRFNGLNMYGYWWTKDKIWDDVPDVECAHFPLEINRKEYNGSMYNYSAYINCGYGNLHAFSVRYIFEPQYK